MGVDPSSGAMRKNGRAGRSKAARQGTGPDRGLSISERAVYASRADLRLPWLDFDEPVADACFVAGLIEGRGAVHETAVGDPEGRTVPRAGDRTVAKLSL